MATSTSVVRWCLDFRCAGVPNERRARDRLSHCGFRFALDFLSHSEDQVSRAAAVGICGDLSVDCDALAHLGAMAFSALFSLRQVRLVGTLAWAYG